MTFRSGTYWKFETARFKLELELTRDRNYKYDGTDEDGSIQAKLDSGEYIAFDSCVSVSLKDFTGNGDEMVISQDHLGGSVYSNHDDGWKDFFKAHRDSDILNRNCSEMKAIRGENVCIGHYFPDMVRQACKEARQQLSRYPKLRA